MKLDKIKFARLIAFINQWTLLNENDIRTIDDMIDVEGEASNEWVAVERVDELLRQINAIDGFIPAIKAYRALTGVGLLEAKKTIDCYRNVRSTPKLNEQDMLFQLLMEGKADISAQRDAAKWIKELHGC